MDNIVFHSGSGMPDSLTLEGECSPFSLKYSCQQLDKFLEGTCWNLFVPLVPSLRGAFAIRGAQTQLLNWLFAFIFSSLMHHYSYRNKPKKKKVLAWSHNLAHKRRWVHFQLWRLDTHHQLDPSCWEWVAPTGSRDCKLLRWLGMNVQSTKSQV